MNKIAVSVESSADLSAELIEKYDIKVIPYSITLANEMIKDGEKSAEELFAFVDETGVLPKTTALNEVEYEDFFTALKNDYDVVIHFCLSGGITSSCDHALRAAENVGKVFVIDSRSLSMGTGLLAIYARELAIKDTPVSKIVESVKETVKKTVTSFVIERLDYLYKGGRCSSLALLGANLLKIRPRIVMKEGKMVSDKKYRGTMTAVISKFAEDLISEFTPVLDKVSITYTTAAPEMLNAAVNACKSAGFKEILINRAGATIASHCGANTLGIFYIGE